MQIGVAGEYAAFTPEAARRPGVAILDAANQATKWQIESARSLGDPVRRHPAGNRLDDQLDEMPPLRLRGSGGIGLFEY